MKEDFTTVDWKALRGGANLRGSKWIIHTDIRLSRTWVCGSDYMIEPLLRACRLNAELPPAMLQLLSFDERLLIEMEKPGSDSLHFGVDYQGAMGQLSMLIRRPICITSVAATTEAALIDEKNVVPLPPEIERATQSWLQNRHHVFRQRFDGSFKLVKKG